MSPLIVQYSPAYAVDDDLETIVKSRHVARFIQTRPEFQKTVALRAPKPVTREELATIHTEAYINRSFDSKKGRLEPAIRGWSQEVLNSILATTGGMRDAVNQALRDGRSGSLSSGLHHAERSQGKGFCHFNGLALAALEALKHVNKVGVLDLDAHAGGGTFDILGENPRVHLADVALDKFDAWTPTDAQRHFYRFSSPKSYLRDVEASLRSLEGINFLIYNAGMDAHEEAALGNPAVPTKTIKEREQMVVQWARDRNIPHIFALAGGYVSKEDQKIEEVAELHLMTIAAFAA
jgi:acetoin utilization deacetylase AcuC-like enzyme